MGSKPKCHLCGVNDAVPNQGTAGYTNLEGVEDKRRERIAKNRDIARTYVQSVRESTRCRNCGEQPIEWHSEAHITHTRMRVGVRVYNGHSIATIQKEIDRCTPLCRRCHMKEDGRLERLLKNCPRQKGVEIPAKNCRICGTAFKPLRNGRCRACYFYHREHGGIERVGEDGKLRPGTRPRLQATTHAR